MFTIILYCLFADVSSSYCAVGFLNIESLYRIVDAPMNDSIHRSLCFKQHTPLSMPLTKSGHLVRFIIAAKYNHSVPSGWPTIQIRRSVADSYSREVATTTQEPRPTGYLNVFEYKVSSEIQSGDVVHIHISEPATESSEKRYLLAYDIVGDTSKPMVSIEVSNHNNKNKSPASATSTTAIVVGVLCILVVLILLAVAVSITIVIYRCKNNDIVKDPSSGVSDAYATVLPSSSAHILHNPTYSSAIGKFHVLSTSPYLNSVHACMHAGNLAANTIRSEATEDVYLSDYMLHCMAVIIRERVLAIHKM